MHINVSRFRFGASRIVIKLHTAGIPKLPGRYVGVRGLVSGLGGGGRRWMGGRQFHNFMTESQNAMMTYFQHGI